MLISENCLIRMPITKHINELEFFFMFLEAKKFVQNYIFFPRSHFSSLCSNWCKKLYIMCIQFFHFRKLIFFSFTFLQLMVDGRVGALGRAAFQNVAKGPKRGCGNVTAQLP